MVSELESKVLESSHHGVPKSNKGELAFALAQPFMQGANNTHEGRGIGSSHLTLLFVSDRRGKKSPVDVLGHYSQSPMIHGQFPSSLICLRSINAKSSSVFLQENDWKKVNVLINV